MPMNDDRSTNAPFDQLLNELYWETDRTIEEILGELGVGRNALYASIRPLSTASECPTCVETMIFTNRTNRAANLATCEGCGFEHEMEGMSGADARPRSPVGEEDTGPRIDRHRMVMIGGVTVLGAAAGIALTHALKR